MCASREREGGRGRGTRTEFRLSGPSRGKGAPALSPWIVTSAGTFWMNALRRAIAGGV